MGLTAKARRHKRGTFVRSKRPAGFPASLRIRNDRWRVRYATSLKDDDDDDAWGLCDYEKHIIWIDPTHEAIAATLLHECWHAYEHYIDLSGRKETLGEAKETLADQISYFVRDLFRANRGMRWIRS